MIQPIEVLVLLCQRKSLSQTLSCATYLAYLQNTLRLESSRARSAHYSVSYNLHIIHCMSPPLFLHLQVSILLFYQRSVSRSAILFATVKIKLLLDELFQPFDKFLQIDCWYAGHNYWFESTRSRYSTVIQHLLVRDELIYHIRLVYIVSCVHVAWVID